jgi:hypothetical protein
MIGGRIGNNMVVKIDVISPHFVKLVVGEYLGTHYSKRSGITSILVQEPSRKSPTWINPSWVNHIEEVKEG